MERSASGWINGFIGVVIFAGSLPATRLAVLQLDAGFVTAARATIAAVLGLGLLLMLRQPWPRRSDLPGLVVVSLGVVVGFPLLTALALRHASSAHTIVFLGLLPLSTAVFSMLLGFLFWYRGLAQGGIAAVGQLQLLQPFFAWRWLRCCCMKRSASAWCW